MGAWIPTIKKHDRRLGELRTNEEIVSSQSSEDQNLPITANLRDIDIEAWSVDLITWWSLAVSSRNVYNLFISDYFMGQIIILLLYSTTDNDQSSFSRYKFIML